MLTQACGIALLLSACVITDIDCKRVMATTIDSEAYFEARMTTMMISAPIRATMIARGWNTMASFAFSSAYIPQGGDDAQFRTSVLQPLIGDGFEIDPNTPRLRRLFFESHTLAVVDLRRRAEPSHEDNVVKVPIEERKVRMDRLRARLVGLDIRGQLEPSHSLIDVLVSQLEGGVVRYVPWTSCTMRDQEVQGIKSVSLDATMTYAPDAAGFMKASKKEEALTVNVDDNLLLTYALQRRALAYELAGICPYETMHSLTEMYMREFMRPAANGFNKVSVAQLQYADRQAYLRMADDCSGGLARRADGSNPTTVSVRNLLLDTRFNFLLMQMPTGGRSAGGPGSKANRVDGERDRSRSKTRRAQQSKAAKDKASPKVKSKKGKGKGGGSGGGSSGSQDFSLTTNKTKDGANICFNFNKASGCKEEVKDGKCKKGMHVCWLIGCQQSHSATNHT